MLLVSLIFFSCLLTGHDTIAGQSGHGESASHGNGGEAHGEEHHGIHVFVAEFSRVEIPFIIALWIFCASLAKIGKPRLFNEAIVREGHVTVSRVSVPNSRPVAPNTPGLFVTRQTFHCSKGRKPVRRWLNDLLLPTTGALVRVVTSRRSLVTRNGQTEGEEEAKLLIHELNCLRRELRNIV